MSMSALMTGKPSPSKIFKPLPWQVAPWRDKSSVMLLTGSAGGGKSHLALEKINGYCLKYPNTFALMARKVRVSMTSGSVLFFEDEVAVEKTASILHGATHVPSKSRFEFANGSVLAYIGIADKKDQQKLRSIGKRGGVDIAFLEEATEFTESDFNAVRARMRGTAASWRQVILACNPDAPTHWIYRRLIINQEGSVYYSSDNDNPHNPLDYKETLATLTGVDKLRLADGQWVQASGLVYDTFSYEENVTAEADYRPDLEVLWLVDEGYSGEYDQKSGTYSANSHPRVILFCQQWPNGDLCVFAESFAVRTRDEQQITEALSLPYAVPEYAVVDKSAASLKGLLAMTFGIPTRNSPPRVEDSIKEMRRWVSPDKNGHRRLKLHPRCKHTIQEFSLYRYREDGDEKPIKEYDHGLDALRGGTWALRFT
jgi:hypothetical protein